MPHRPPGVCYRSDVRQSHRTHGDSPNTTALLYGQEAVRECIRTNAWVARQLQMKGSHVALYMHEVGFNSADNTNAVLFVAIPSN